MQRLQVFSDEVLSVTPGLTILHFTGWKERELTVSTWGPSENNRKARSHELSQQGVDNAKLNANSGRDFPV